MDLRSLILISFFLCCAIADLEGPAPAANSAETVTVAELSAFDALSPDQLDALDDPLRSTLQNGPLSQTVTELGGRPILSQAFDLSKANANEPYRIVRRERLRLPTYVHDISGGITPAPLPSFAPLPFYQAPAGAFGAYNAYRVPAPAPQPIRPLIFIVGPQQFAQPTKQ